MDAREDLRLSGAVPAEVAEAREASHVTRSAVTAPQVALTVLLPQLRRDIDGAVRATYEMRHAQTAEILAAQREKAVAAADALTASAARVPSRP
ncbi:hypothetical protein ACH4CE_24730 [Streptomyces gelaticus]|uniref:hypothetical protein n=1 Tax=Streptomyces gelaticus TaxID=285446 RepID=UPI003788A36A